MQPSQVSISSDSELVSPSISSPPLRLQRVRRPEVPDKAAHLAQIESLQSEIDSFQQRMIEIKSILDNRYQNRHVASPELTAARKKLSDLNANFKEVLERKRAHREELELVKEKLQASGFRPGLPKVTVEELDEQIRKLEYRQIHTSLPIDEEKRLITQIERLKKSRDALHRHGSRAEQDQGSRTELIDLIQKDEQELDALKVEQEQYRQILAGIRNKETANAIDVPALLQEKHEAYENIKDLRERFKQHKTEFSAKEDEYWRREKEWRAQQAQERKLKAEKSRAEWLEREKIRKQRALENFVEPYTDEIIICEQLLSYIQKNVPQDEGCVTPQQLQNLKITPPEGFGVALISKKNRSDDELDGWFAGSAGKKGKKSKGLAAPKSKARERLSLSIDALSSFEKLNIAPPATFGNCTQSIDELKLKKGQFLEMQKRARELREIGENGDSHSRNVEEGEISEISGQEASSTEYSTSVGESGPCDDNTPVGDGKISILTDARDVISSTETVDVGVSLEQDKQVDIVCYEVKNNTQLDDKAHLETFEFSEARSGTEENAHIEEQATDNGVTSVIFDCAAENGALKELSSEDIKVKESVREIAENGVDSHVSDCETAGSLSPILDKTPGTINGSESFVSQAVHGKREVSNGMLQSYENGKELSPVVEDQLVADSAEGKVLNNGGCKENSSVVTDGN